MKRIIVLFAAALLAQAAFADDIDEPSEQSVLEAARAKYWQDQRSSDERRDADVSVDIDIAVNEAGSDDQDADHRPEKEEGDDVPFTPFLISFVPGLSAPFGYYDVSFAAGAIGTMTRGVRGAAGAGVFNISRDVRGLQGAGVFNISRDVKGLQGAGVFNMADGLRGCQAAGVFNMARDVSGVQVAGVLNVADRVKGVQIGLVNIADNIDGVQIGLLNIAGNGVDSLGVLYEPETNWFYAQWQSGTPALFSVVGIGAPGAAWFEDWREFSVFAGLGTRARLLGVNLDLDVCAVQPVVDLPSDRESWDSGDAWDSLRPYPSARLTAGVPIFGKRCQIVGGLKVDIDVASLGERIPEDLRKGDSWSDAWFGERFTVWPKWFVGVKF